jgi:hypothetical protein
VTRGLWQTELQRGRWRSEKERLHLADPGREDFCQDAFGFDPGPRVRLLLLPGDPEAQVIEFDADLWSLLDQLTDPALGQPAEWGSAVRGWRVAMRARTYQHHWSHYLAVFRSGAVEMGLGEDAAFERDGRWWFRLVTIVGRAWAALEAFSQIQAQYDIPGPVQLTLAFNDTEGASLSQLGAEWNQYWDQSCCRERRFAHVLEMDERLSSESAKVAAFRLGARIEESFGSMDLRFLDREGDRAGEFASAGYRWH